MAHIDLNNNNLNTPEGKIAKEVAQQYIMKKVGKPFKNLTRKETELMIRLTNEIEIKYEIPLNNMCNKLNVNSDNAARIFWDIADEIFLDGINWGRIIVLYAFGGKLAEHAKKYNDEKLIDRIGQWVGCFVANKASWIKETGRGWNGFVEMFHDAKPERETTWFQGMFAATVGLGTLAAALYIKS